MYRKQVKYLIIGAGISGLSLANNVINEDYLIIEKEKEVGGYCKSFYKNDFIWDFAGHFFHFKDEEKKKYFIEAIGKDNIITQKKNTKILYKDKYIDYPFQKNIHQLEKGEFIECLCDLFERGEKNNYENFLDMLYGKFGKGIVDKFLKPYNEKLYACDLKSLDKDAMGRFFPFANLEEIIHNMRKQQNTSYNDMFLYPRKGAGSFINYLYQKLNREKIKLDTEVIVVDTSQKEVTTSKQEKIKYEYLINTIPLNRFLTLLHGKEQELQLEMSYNKVLVFNLGFKKEGKNKEHWIYIPDKDINFYRIGFYNNILNTKKLSMYIEIGFSKNDIIDINRQLELTLQNLRKLHITEENELESCMSIIMDPAYVHITKSTNEKIEEMKSKWQDEQIYTIGRYGAWTYCSMEDCMIEAEKLVKKIKNEK